jgi:hypothetical protein
MKQTLLIAILIVASIFGNTVLAQRTCHTMEVLAEMEKEDPMLRERMNLIEEHTQNLLMSQTEAVNGIITIPVVVHVVYRTTTENISTAQVLSQITVLNNDFRRLNADKTNTPSVFEGLASDVEVQFCLATVDPNGNATNGIIRKATTKRSFGTNNSVKFNSQGGSDAWPRDSYLNIWVCNIGGNILGYAQFPGGNAATDGVVCDYRYFGTIGTATAPFHLGRTATHEVGHWLNLRHIWGDGGCSVDDLVFDTPLAGAPNYTSSPCTFPGANSCNSGTGDLPDMFQNYMDYSDDGCMNLFTQGQSDRMRTLFGPGGARAALLNSVGCGGTPPPPAEPTCSDGVQNGNETGIDCGGSCPPCPVIVCDAPTNLAAQSRKAGKEAVISWTAATSATSYEVSLKQSSASTWGNSLTLSGTSVTATGLTKGTSYDFRVRSNCSGGVQSTYAFLTFAPRFAENEVIKPEIKIYPNPASTVVNVEIISMHDEEMNVLVLDATGRAVYSAKWQLEKGENSIELDTSPLATGIYFIRLQSLHIISTEQLSVLK